MYWPHSFNSSVYQGVWRGHPCGWVTLAPTFGWRRTFSSSTIYLGFMPVVVWGVIRNWNRKNQSMQSKIPRSPSVVTGPIMWPIYWPAKPRWSLDHEWLDHSHGWIGGGACIWFLWNWEPFPPKSSAFPGTTLMIWQRFYSRNAWMSFVQHFNHLCSSWVGTMTLEPHMIHPSWTPSSCWCLAQGLHPPAQLFHFLFTMVWWENLNKNILWFNINVPVTRNLFVQIY